MTCTPSSFAPYDITLRGNIGRRLDAKSSTSSRGASSSVSRSFDGANTVANIFTSGSGAPSAKTSLPVLFYTSWVSRILEVIGRLWHLLVLPAGWS